LKSRAGKPQIASTVRFKSGCSSSMAEEYSSHNLWREGRWTAGDFFN
jgi:hypothetical protein